jgi:hypothetical protein
MNERGRLQGVFADVGPPDVVQRAESLLVDDTQSPSVVAVETYQVPLQ